MRLVTSPTRLFGFWRLAGRDLRLLWFALGHARRPRWLVPAAVLLIVWVFDPLNVAVPLLGVVDDLLLLPLVLQFLARCLPPDILRDFGRWTAPAQRS